MLTVAPRAFAAGAAITRRPFLFVVVDNVRVQLAEFFQVQLDVTTAHRRRRGWGGGAGEIECQAQIDKHASSRDWKLEGIPSVMVTLVPQTEQIEDSGG